MREAEYERVRAQHMAERERQAAFAAAEAEARAALTAEDVKNDDEIAIDRASKVAERDAAVKLILAKKSKTLRAALGLDLRARPAEVAKRVRRLLRLLHPDFGINREAPMAQIMRIEAAFKKLTGLRDKED